jgi:hypothetical protein
MSYSKEDFFIDHVLPKIKDFILEVIKLEKEENTEEARNRPEFVDMFTQMVGNACSLGTPHERRAQQVLGSILDAAHDESDEISYRIEQALYLVLGDDIDLLDTTHRDSNNKTVKIDYRYPKEEE